MPEQGVSDLEKKTAAQAVGKVDTADPSLTTDRLGVRIQGDGFDCPFAGTKPEPEAEKVGNAKTFGLLLQVGARIGACFLKGGAHRKGNADRGILGQNRIEPQSIPEAEDDQDDSYERHQTQKKVIHILHRPLAAELESLIPGTALESMKNGIHFLKSFPFDLQWSE